MARRLFRLLIDNMIMFDEFNESSVTRSSIIFTKTKAELVGKPGAPHAAEDLVI